MGILKGQSVLRTTAGAPRRGGKWLNWFLILLVVGLFVGALSIVGVFLYYSRGLPDLSSMKGYDPVRVTRIYGANGELIGELIFDGTSGERERRTTVPIKEIPPRLIDAFLSAEDADFYQHAGIDYLGIARALMKGVANQEFTQGASTITQQVVKTFLLTPERTFKRKFQELILAKQMEQYLTKDEILELYLNQIYFGHQRYGIVEAARYYFNKDLKSLTLSEMAILGGLPKAPSDLNPQEAQKSPEKMKESINRRRFVLRQMVQKGKITQAEMDAAEKEEIPFQKPDEQYLGVAPGFVSDIKKQLEEIYDPEVLSRLGARVETGLDPKMQAEAQKALRAALEKLDIDQGYRDPKHEHPKNPQKFLEDQVDVVKEAMRADKLSINDSNLDLRYGRTYKGLIVGVSDKLGGYVVNVGGVLGWLSLKEKNRYNPKEKAPSAFASLGDVVPIIVSAPLSGPTPKTWGEFLKKDANAKITIEVSIKDNKNLSKELALALGPEGALVSIDPETFEIRAMVGGYEDKAGELNRATQAKRQPGSTFKPVVYAAALDLKCAQITMPVTGAQERRCYSPSSIVRDQVIVSDDGKWVPKNADNKELGEISMRRSLALSRNLSTINLAREISMEKVIEFAKKLGYQSTIQPSLPSAIGASEVSPMEQAVAYAIFASGGLYKKPVYLRKIIIPGQEPKVFDEKRQQVIPTDTAYLITSLLQSVVTEGTGSKAKELGRPAAGKTGTTNKSIDAWFVGYTPNLVAAIWLGFDDRRPLPNPKKGKGVSGGGNVAPFWTQFIKASLAGKPTYSFKEPTGIVHMRIDPKTGLKAYDEQKNAREEVFSLDAVPSETAPMPDEATVEDYILSNSAATPTAPTSSSKEDHSNED